MLVEKIEKLKIMLLKEEDFAKTLKYYLDSVIFDPEFMPASQLSDDPLVHKTFTLVAEVMEKRNRNPVKQTVEFVLPVQYAEAFQIYHAALRVGESMGIIFLFRDIDVGLGSLLHTKDGMSHFSRFSCFKLNEEGSIERPGALH